VSRSFKTAASGTECQRPIGHLKAQVIFREIAANHRALLREMSYKDKAFYDSTPRCSIRRCIT